MRFDYVSPQNIPTDGDGDGEVESGEGRVWGLDREESV